MRRSPISQLRMNRATLLTKNACIIYQQNYAFVIAFIAPFQLLGKCHIVLAFREFILNLVMTCRYFRNYFQYSGWMERLHHMIEKVISVLACNQDMQFDDKAVFRSANQIATYTILLFQCYVFVWLQNDYTAHSCVQEIYGYLCFCYRTVLCNDSGTEKNARNSSFSCCQLVHGTPSLLVTTYMGAFGFQTRHNNMQYPTSICRSNVVLVIVTSSRK